MKRIETIESLQMTRKHWRAQGKTIALVPTMGALHAGHMALVEQARALADTVVVSIFVNPAQFAPNEDLSRYPRTLQSDERLLEENHVDALWFPDDSLMYPKDFATHILAQGAAKGLCGDVRAGHFDGVALVVVKLCNQVKPDIVVFGEKDYQQCCVIRQTLRDLDMDIRMHTVATVREADGLAMSSRNRYLTPTERVVAPTLYRALEQLKLAIENKTATEASLSAVRKQLLADGFSHIEYLELRDADNLTPIAVESFSGKAARLLIAARIGSTRLIDNIAIGESS